MDIELQRIVLKRLFRASADYYLMKETGECRGATKVEIKDEMAAALVDARLTCDPEAVGEKSEPITGEYSAPFAKQMIPGGLQKLEKVATRTKEGFFSKMLKGVFKHGENEPRQIS